MKGLRRILILFAAVAAVADAAELRSVEVDYADGQYSLDSVVWFDASVDDIYHVFRRWDYSPRFSSAIVEAEDLEADELGRPGFYVMNRGCVLFFCKSLVRRGYVEAEPNHVLRAFADPAESDFLMSNETWEFEPEGHGTVVTYSLRFEPAFWVPPAIGPWMIQRKLRKDGGRALDRIEAIAQTWRSQGATR